MVDVTNMRWLGFGSVYLLTSGVLLLGFGSCELFGEECTHGMWCEDGKVMYCDDEDSGGFWGSAPTVEVSSTCTESETCMEWSGRHATCVSDHACEVKDSFCIGDSLADCPDGEEKPEIHACAYEVDEGEECVEQGIEARCAYYEDLCVIENAEKCTEMGRDENYFICQEGYWLTRELCPYGTECVQVSDTEVECLLATHPTWGGEQ